MATSLLEALPIWRLFRLLFTLPAIGVSASQLLHLLHGHADACLGSLD
jgi:hypothetical protein